MNYMHVDGRRTVADENLWGVYLKGPDEWHAAKSMWHAMELAHQTNADWIKHSKRDPSLNDPHFWATPDLWPFTESEHQRILREEPV